MKAHYNHHHPTRQFKPNREELMGGGEPELQGLTEVSEVTLSDGQALRDASQSQGTGRGIWAYTLLGRVRSS